MKEFRVKIPKEYYQILEFKQDGLRGIAAINTNLRDFEPKEVFSWHCSIMLELEELDNTGMPSSRELEIINEFEDLLDTKIKEGEELNKPNALFLGRITWNGTRELIWKVYDPEKTNSLLQNIIEQRDHARPFDYRIEKDEAWKLSEWYLKSH